MMNIKSDTYNKCTKIKCTFSASQLNKILLRIYHSYTATAEGEPSLSWLVDW